VEHGGDQPRAEVAVIAGAREQRQVVDRVLRLHDRRDTELRGEVEAPHEPAVGLIRRVVGDLRGERRVAGA
jgi:hypothetical protein